MVERALTRIADSAIIAFLYFGITWSYWAYRELPFRTKDLLAVSLLYLAFAGLCWLLIKLTRTVNAWKQYRMDQRVTEARLHRS